jgi:hypothetical protein
VVARPLGWCGLCPTTLSKRFSKPISPRQHELQGTVNQQTHKPTTNGKHQTHRQHKAPKFPQKNVHAF